jgi:hypothetical protein
MLKNPLGSYDVCLRRLRNKGPCLVVEESPELISHGGLQVRVLHGLVKVVGTCATVDSTTERLRRSTGRRTWPARVVHGAAEGIVTWQASVLPQQRARQGVW